MGEGSCSIPVAHGLFNLRSLEQYVLGYLGRLPASLVFSIWRNLREHENIEDFYKVARSSDILLVVWKACKDNARLRLCMESLMTEAASQRDQLPRRSKTSKCYETKDADDKKDQVGEMKQKKKRIFEDRETYENMAYHLRKSKKPEIDMSVFGKGSSSWMRVGGGLMNSLIQMEGCRQHAAQAHPTDPSTPVRVDSEQPRVVTYEHYIIEPLTWISPQGPYPTRIAVRQLVFENTEDTNGEQTVAKTADIISPQPHSKTPLRVDVEARSMEDQPHSKTTEWGGEAATTRE